MTLDFTTTLQAIFAEGADYTKKSVETRLALGEKLLGAKSFDTVIQIQTEYAKTAYADFVAEATKMGELHSEPRQGSLQAGSTGDHRHARHTRHEVIGFIRSER